MKKTKKEIIKKTKISSARLVTKPGIVEGVKAFVFADTFFMLGYENNEQILELTFGKKTAITLYEKLHDYITTTICEINKEVSNG